MGAWSAGDRTPALLRALSVTLSPSSKATGKAHAKARRHRWGKRPACRSDGVMEQWSDGAKKRQRRALSQPRVKP